MSQASENFLADALEPYCVEGIYLTEADRYIFWIGGSITMLATFFVMLSSYRFQEVRKQPGDLILGIVISDFTLCVHWILIAIWYKLVDSTAFCVVVGTLGVYAGINEFLYNVSFSLYLIITLRSTLKQSRIPKKRFHVINLTASFAFIVYMLANNKIGKTLTGTCSLKAECNKGSSSGLLLALLYTGLGAYTYYYIKENVPKCQRVHKKRTEFLLYYLRYIVASSVIYVIIAIFSLVNAIVGNRYDFRQKHTWINSIFNIVKLCCPLVLSFIRYSDPFIRKAMIRTLMFWKWKENTMKSKSTRTEPLLPVRLEEPIELGEVSPAPRKRFQTTVPEFQMFENRVNRYSSSSRGSIEEFIVNDLSTSKKLELTYTLLSCLLYAHQTEHQSSLLSSQSYEKKKNNPLSHQVVYLIDEEIIKGSLPKVKQNLERTKYRILPGSLKVYCPEIFTSFLFEDRDYLDVIESLDFDFNKEQMKSASAGAGQGGKSGEFFFFSADKKLILKTVPDSEMRMLIKILGPMREHFNQYPNSLIAKVYAAITYENTDEKLKFNLVLLKNVNGFPSKYVERVYDMKGSKHDREVLKTKEKENVSLSELKQYVLKDLDFLRIEKCLHLDPKIRGSFLQQIEIDSLFFRNNYLIDYSFMVFYVNKARYYSDVGPFNDFTARNPLASLQNMHEVGMYYNVGIIDYLQPYSIKKILEKYFKRLRAWDSKLETSTQDPKYYSERFIRFIKKITWEEV